VSCLSCPRCTHQDERVTAAHVTFSVATRAINGELDPDAAKTVARPALKMVLRIFDLRDFVVSPHFRVKTTKLKHIVF
jgi:hypothetical protein